MKEKRIEIRLSKLLFDLLEAESTKQQMTKSELIRYVLLNYLNKRGGE